MKENNKKFWNGYSGSFDSLYGNKKKIINNFLNRYLRKSMRIRFSKVVENIPEKAESVLDIGCGPGHFCIALVKKGVLKIKGIDFSENMISLAKENAEKLDNKAELDFEVVDFLKYQPDIKYDYSIMMGFIEYFKSPEKVLQKVIELTNKEVFISFPVKGGLLGLQRELRYRRRCFLKLYSLSDIQELMQKQNIKDYDVEKINRDYFVTLKIEP